jgi:AhpD family alkylhydroperoxidase
MDHTIEAKAGGSHGAAVQDALRDPARELRRAIPGVYKGFLALHEEALAPGALDVKTKELIALAIAVTKGCDGCIAAHARAAALRGASRDEAAEAIGVAILMNGGPGTTHGPRAFAAFREFQERLQLTPAG